MPSHKLKSATSLMAMLVLTGLYTSYPNQAFAVEQDTSGIIEEIVVTSRRQEESLQTVPVAVTAFSASDLERLAPRTLRDLDGMIPNAHIGAQTAGPNMGAVFIRGLGYQDVEKDQSPTVAVVIDGLVQGTTTGQLIDVFDVAQIEVNRGPQGVLYGKNTTGGTITVKRVEPKFNEWGFDLAGQFGEYDESALKARINIPLVDDMLALKIGAIFKEREGYYDNITLGGDEGAVDYEAYTVALLYEPNDRFRAKFTYDRLEDTSDSVAMDARFNGDSPFVNENDWHAETDYEQDMYNLSFDWDLGFATLHSITGYVDSTDDVEQDFDSSSLANFAGTVANPIVPLLGQLHTFREQTYEQFSQELRLSGEFNEDVRFNVGAFYWDADITLDQTTNVVPNLALPPIFPDCATLGLVATGGAIPFFDHPALPGQFCQTPNFPDPTGTLGPTAGSLSFQSGEQSVESWAVFGSVAWDVTDAVELTAGLRYIDEEKTLKNDFTSLALPAPAGFPVDQKESWDEVIGELTANWLIDEDLTAYASFSQGFRSGGFSIRANVPSQTTYEPETVDSFEIGLKSDLFDKRLRLNLAAFYTVVDDPIYNVVLQDPLQAPGTNTVINNGDETEVFGFEVEGIAAFHENFSVIFAMGYLDGESKEYSDDGTRLAVGPNGTAGAPGPVTVPDQDLARSPDWNWAITPIYDRQFGAWRFTASLTAKGQDDWVIVNSTFGADFTQDGETLVDARLALETTLGNGDTLTFSVFGKNITDQEYLAFMLPLGDVGGFQGWGQPKVWAAEVRWSR